MLGLCCYAQTFSSSGEQGLLLHCDARTSHLAASLAVERGLQGVWASAAVARGLESTGSAVVAQELSCSTVYGIFPDQGLNLCL